MTDDLRPKAQAIIDEWRPRLGLDFPAWRVHLKLDEMEDQANADAVQCYRDLVVRLNPNRITEKTDLEELVLHELCHAFTARLWEYADRLLLCYRPPSELSQGRWTLEQMHEEATTAIAYALLALKRG